MKSVGTMSIGIKTPIIKPGDDLVSIVVNSVMKALTEQKLELNDKDIIGVTEAVVGKAERNFATTAQIASDIKAKFGDETVGLIFPILSRNRFSLLLKGIASGVKKLIIQLSYPYDEVGNPIVNEELLHKYGVNFFSDTFTSDQFECKFGKSKHLFTGMNYIELYKQIAGENCEIILSNNPVTILKHTKYVINADIHTRTKTKKILLTAGATKVVSLDEILTESIDGSGWNPKYGILGSNISTNDTVKLFPRDAQIFVEKLQVEFANVTGKKIECLVYGDGAFKDPVGGIWELADPVVSPAFTSGLLGTPNELKLKYIADNDIGTLTGEYAKKAIVNIIAKKRKNLVGNSQSLGTTPRRYVDLIGSLCDLTSGSGDKGTPVVLIKNYFDNYAN